VGVLAKTVREAGRLHSVLAQTSAAAAIEASEVRLAVPETYFVDDLDTATTRCWEFALESLTAAGVTLVPVSAGRLAARESTIGRAITCFEARIHLMPYLRHATGLEDDEIVAGIASPDVQALFTDSILPNGRASVSEHEYRLAMADRRALRDAFASALDASDAKALLFPTTPAVAQPLAGARSAVFETTIRNTVPGSVAGLPGITIPVPLDVTGGLPVGIALDALPGQDNEVVSMAAVLESALTQGAS
jgi:mandelamide amidase